MRAELYSLDCPMGGRLSIMARPRGGDWLSDEIRALRDAGVDVLVSLLTAAEAVELGLLDEEAWCGRHALEYRWLPIADRGVPESRREVSQLLEGLAQDLANGRHVAVHCRQGIGRSSLIAACLIVAQGLSSEEAFERIAAARGCPVPDTDEQRAWVSAFRATDARRR
jgi:protein-tyrosine phosphatase